MLRTVLAAVIERALATGGDAELRSALTSADRVGEFATAVGHLVRRPDIPVAQLEALLDGWAALSGDENAVLACAAVAAYGEVGVVRPDWRDDEIGKLRKAAGDERPAVRQAAAEALQRLARTTRPLWTCEPCNRRFVTANLWHSCHVGTPEEFFAGHPHLRPLFDAYVRFVESIGPFEVGVIKTRIRFTTRARFAGVARLRRDALVASFWLKRQVESDRFLKVEHLERDDWIYHLLLRSEDDLDHELRAWLEEAYRVGRQER